MAIALKTGILNSHLISIPLAILILKDYSANKYKPSSEGEPLTFPCQNSSKTVDFKLTIMLLFNKFKQQMNMLHEAISFNDLFAVLFNLTCHSCSILQAFDFGHLVWKDQNNPVT